jgi:hypothetical protein
MKLSHFQRRSSCECRGAGWYSALMDIVDRFLVIMLTVSAMAAIAGALPL